MNIDTRHPKMSREDRAKQFMPFAALKGYEEALRAKEAEVEALNAGKREPLPDDISPQDSDIP